MIKIHITNINRALINIKSEVIADFVQSEQSGIVITIKKVVTSLDLQTIKCYVKNANNIQVDNVKAPYLPQSKSYLKIIDITYFLKNINTPLTVDMVETIIKNNHIFNNIAITSRPRVIKVSLKANMAIIWLDIWDVQSRIKAKGLINQCFNIGSFIAIIQGVNMNLGIL